MFVVELARGMFHGEFGVMMAKSIATLLREKDMVKKAGLKKETAERLVADIDAQIEELASQMPFRLGAEPVSSSNGSKKG